MKFTFKSFILLAFVFASAINAQRTLKITFDTGMKNSPVSYLTRHGIVYASSRDLASAISGNYFYNKKADKVEIKFRDYKIKLTARNQYIVITKKYDGAQNVFQLPISTRLIKRDVFVPLLYTLPYLEMASGKEIEFDNGRKHLAFTGKHYSYAPHTDHSDGKKAVSKNADLSSPYDIQNIFIDEKSNGTLIRLTSKRRINKFSSSIKEGKLFLFFSGIKVAPNLLQTVKPSGLVRKIRMKNVSGNIQIEFSLKSGYETHESFVDPENGDIIITIHNKLLASAKDNHINELVDKWKFDVIVIDAGHGGKDGGAIGITGVKEKNVNLGIALKLGKLIEKNIPGVKVVYTRKTDKFVELFRRGKIANENNGKLFISIHCNSLHKKPSGTSGYEIYLLRPGRTKEAISIAEFENSVIHLEDNPDRYQKLTDENFILVSMAHSAFMRYSEKFSDLLNKQYSKYTPIKSRGIKQAGFYVLVGASMPGILLETGFLSNRKDEKYLYSKKGQQNIANSVYRAIKDYIKYYNTTIDEEN